MTIDSLPTSADVGSTEIADFVARVRDLLADLSEEDRRELTEGLEADLTDQVAERRGGTLGDPAEYARELRVAAGFPAEAARLRRRMSIAARAEAVLDAGAGKWRALVGDLPGDPWGLLETLRPAWWILRAWVALQAVDLVWGSGSRGWGLSPLPSLKGLGLPLLVVAILVSVQIGRGRLWPGRRGAFGRVALLIANAVALAFVPVVLTSVLTPSRADAFVRTWQPENSGTATYDQGYADAEAAHDLAGIYADGRWVSNIYPYDAAGRPLVGVQLFDQTGKPIDVITQTECVYGPGNTVLDKARVYYPWSNGADQRRNVFPVPSVVADGRVTDPDPMAFQRKHKPGVGQFPFAHVPKVSLPGLLTSAATTPAKAYAKGVLPPTTLNPIDRGC